MSTRWTIGASPDCDLTVGAPGVSARHCRLTLDDAGYSLEDLGSKEGTFVNGARIAGRAAVSPNDAITLGPDRAMPWPPEAAGARGGVLRVGREPDNDVVIALPIVSGYHAKITWEGRPGHGIVEDLGSSNGTAIGSLDRPVNRSAFSASDTLYFGNHPVLGAELLARLDPSLAPPLVFLGAEMVVGRDPSCQKVLDLVTVSGRHARFRRAGGQITLEDLGSSNGTFVNGRKIAEPTEVRPGDLIGLGRESFRLALQATAAEPRRLASKPQAKPQPRAQAQTQAQPERPLAGPGPTIRLEPRAVPGGGSVAARSGPLGHPLVLLGLLAQAPALAILIGLAFGSGVSSPLPSEASRATASILFSLGLASIWFGLSGGVVGLLLDPSRPKGAVPPHWWPVRLAILAGLGLVQCLLARFLVFPIAGLAGPGASAVGVLILGSLVGLGMGLLIVLIAPRDAMAWGALSLALVGLWLFGGGPWSFPRSAAPGRMASDAAPSRWAFEGLLLSWADRPAPGPKFDVVETYFPAEVDRMGPKADAMALAAMLVGLAASGLVLVRSSGPTADPASP